MKTKVEITIDDSHKIGEISVLIDGVWIYDLLPPKITTGVWESLNKTINDWLNQVKCLSEQDEINET